MRSVPDGGNSMCKGPVVGVKVIQKESIARHRKKGNMAGTPG